MKFAVAVVVLAFAVAVQSSAIPWGWAGHALVAGHHDDGSWHGDNHWDDGHWDPSHDHGHYAHGWGHPAAVVAHHGYGHGLIAGHHGPALVHGHNVVASHVVHGVHGVHGVHDLGHHHQASYVAANRGSVHVAPLAGHVHSVSSSNLSPAPGTNW